MWKLEALHKQTLAIVSRRIWNILCTGQHVQYGKQRMVEAQLWKQSVTSPGGSTEANKKYRWATKVIEQSIVFSVCFLTHLPFSFNLPHFSPFHPPGIWPPLWSKASGVCPPLLPVSQAHSYGPADVKQPTAAVWCEERSTGEEEGLLQNAQYRGLKHFFSFLFFSVSPFVADVGPGTF